MPYLQNKLPTVGIKKESVSLPQSQEAAAAPSIHKNQKALLGMKKNNLTAILVVALVVSLFFNFFRTSNNGGDIDIASYARPDSFTAGIPINQSATCTFPRVESASYQEGIQFKSDKQEATISIAFIDLDTGKPKLKGNNGQSDLIKVADNEDTIAVIEESPARQGTINVFTIFKNERVATWTKQYKLLNIPFGSLAMGYCE
jgi:hypothetical protein